MTSRQLYEGVLIELHKENAPNLLLEDFNYFANKSINQYINKRYNIYDVNQQTTDDLRVLKATAMLTPHQMANDYEGLSLASLATYYVDLPSDYLHMLNCICIYKVKKTYKCYNKDDTWRAAATRLTADAYSLVLDNFWLKPTYKRPYYYIHNINTISGTEDPEEKTLNPISLKFKVESIPVYAPQNDSDPRINNPLKASELFELYEKFTELKYVPDGDFISTGNYHLQGTKVTCVLMHGETIHDIPNLPPERWGHSQIVSIPNYEGTVNGIYDKGVDYIKDESFSRTITIGHKEFDNVERESQVRYGNVSKVRMEIRYGTDDSVFSLKEGKVYIDYIKTPLHIRLTQEELDYTEDKSQVLEFPDYVCQEILNELVHIIMENISDLRLQTHPVVSLSIANPTQALAPEAEGKSA